MKIKEVEEIEDNYSSISFERNENKTVISFSEDGKLFWNGREIQDDKEFKNMIKDIHKFVKGTLAKEAE